MASFVEIAAPWALLLPIVGTGAIPSNSDGVVQSDAPVASETQSLGIAGEATELTQVEDARKKRAKNLQALYNSLVYGQIRIERRVIVRIAPQRGTRRTNLLAQLPQRALNSRYKEKKTGKCVPVERIAGVQTGSGNRLLLFLRDAKILTINLEKACRARDFYSGFYVERNKDGKICVDRDKLQSRNGARCEINRMRQLVAVKDED